MGAGREQSSEGVSRAVVLSALQQAGRALTVTEVAATVQLSIATTRFHLNRLETDGQIRSAREQREHQPGRPRMLYTARRPEAVDAGAAYQHLAKLLAEQLISLAGTSGALAAGRRWAELISSELANPGPAGPGDPDRPDRDDVHRIVTVLDDTGFSPRLSGGGARIELHSCPFMELARNRPDVVCTVHLGLIRGLMTGSGDGVRMRMVLDGSGPCIIRLAA